MDEKKGQSFLMYDRMKMFVYGNSEFASEEETNVKFFIQFGSKQVKDLAIQRGWDKLFESVGVKLIDPGCGACIGAGPGVSIQQAQVTVSAINRNFQGRSGPGKLYLASPLTVAASAFTGKITAWKDGCLES